MSEEMYSQVFNGEASYFCSLLSNDSATITKVCVYKYICVSIDKYSYKDLRQNC